MRIDLNYGPQAASETDRAATQNGAARSESSLTSGAGVTGGTSGEDQAHLSTSQAQVGALTAQASQLPEVRQERVQALRQVVQRGQYQPLPDQVAGAMLDYMSAGPAA